MGFLICAVFAAAGLPYIADTHLLEYSLLPFVLFSLAETIIEPIVVSYVTRIADVRYSNTVLTTHSLFVFVLSKITTSLIDKDYSAPYGITLLAATILGLIAFNNSIRRISFGLK